MADWKPVNGVWLQGALDTDQLPQTLNYARDQNIEYLFPTTQTLNKDGKFTIDDSFIKALYLFMKNVKEYEESAGIKFKVLPVIKAPLKKLEQQESPENTEEGLDLGNGKSRDTAIESISRFIRPDVEGSFVKDIPREFDGVQFSVVDDRDGYDYEMLKRFLRGIRSALPGKTTSLATTEFSKFWEWSRFYYAGKCVDLLVPLFNYPETMTDEEVGTFVKDQVRDILTGVSGNYARDHPTPAVKVLFGFPGYPENGGEKVVEDTAATSEKGATIAEGAVEKVRKSLEENADTAGLAGGVSISLYLPPPVKKDTSSGVSFAWVVVAAAIVLLLRSAL
ncbi:hypothetical protein TWF481_006697 [Arthrobotrys musiformis]|uniref:Uncharacterized protein n=1 Tax=Arthrobotrys musiformis TaxID=47236 RepID=A0AAV9W9A4_9PEZI